MAQEIESVKPAISVIIDDGDFIINSTGPVGKAMLQAILPLAASAMKVTTIVDGEMKVMKRNAAAENGMVVPNRIDQVLKYPKSPISDADAARITAAAAHDIQDSFVADLEAGVTGEVATGEVLAPVSPAKPPARRKPVIFQDAAAPPAPELAQAEMDRLVAEAAQAEQDAAKAAEDRRFQAQQAIQAGEPVEEVAAADPAAAASPRRRPKERALATTGRPCGRCGGTGQTGVEDPSGKVFMGVCGVCKGEGQVKTWDRSLKVR
jgi:hypothetical protein